MKQSSLADTLREQNHTVVPQLVATDTTVQVTEVSGMKGDPMPYKIESDEVIVGSILLSFVLILFALQHGSRSMILYLKGAVTLRRRASLYDEKGTVTSVSSFALCLSTMLSSGVCVYRNFATSLFIEGATPLTTLSVYTLVITLLIVGKYLLYSFVNWVFFSRAKNSQWSQNYWGLIAAAGVVLFPSVLYAVFLDSEVQISDYLFIMILVIFKILLFYKLIGNFFAHLYGVLHLILYFCALEIIPDLFLWKGVEIFNNVFLKL